MGDQRFNTQQLLLLLAVVALVVGLVFHIIYLVKDRSVETAQDEYNKNNSLMFYLLAIGLATAGFLWAKGGSHMKATVEI
jgi:drug/metabolite transporter (DMT)-like permease